jgi:hypothetical protein
LFLSIYDGFFCLGDDVDVCSSLNNKQAICLFLPTQVQELYCSEIGR